MDAAVPPPSHRRPQKAADSRRADIFYSFRFREKHKRICVLLQKRLLLYHALRRGSLSSGYQKPESLEKFFFSVPARDDCQLISSRYKVELSLRILFLNCFHSLEGFRARSRPYSQVSTASPAVLFTHGGEHFRRISSGSTSFSCLCRRIFLST